MHAEHVGCKRPTKRKILMHPMAVILPSKHAHELVHFSTGPSDILD